MTHKEPSEIRRKLMKGAIWVRQISFKGFCRLYCRKYFEVR